MASTKNDNPTPLRKLMKEYDIGVKTIAEEMGVRSSTISTMLKKDDENLYEKLSLEFYIALQSITGLLLNDLIAKLQRYDLEYQVLDFDKTLYNKLFGGDTDE